jgi:predicted DNA-binding transcriptional regulator AlpA
MEVSNRPTGKELGLTAVRGRLLTTNDLANFLRVSERWVQTHMKDGTFPVAWYLIGERDHVVDSADLDDWLKKTRIQAGTALLPVKAVKKLLKEEVIA